MTWRGAVEGPRSRCDAQGKCSDEEDLEDIFASWHQKTANRRMIDDDKTEGNNEQRLQDSPPSDRPPATNRQIHDEEPMAKRQKTTVGRSRKRMRRQRRWHRAMKNRRPRRRKTARRCRKGQLRPAPQLPGARVPICVFW